MEEDLKTPLIVSAKFLCWFIGILVDIRIIKTLSNYGFNWILENWFSDIVSLFNFLIWLLIHSVIVYSFIEIINWFKN